MDHSEERFWYCWIYRTESTPVEFIYGYAAQSNIPATESQSMVTKVSDDILECYFPLSQELGDEFFSAFDDGVINFEILDDCLGKEHCKFMQSSIQPALGSSTAKVDSYYTMNVTGHDFLKNEIQSIFRHFQSSLPFAEPQKFMHRLGAFDIIHMPIYAEDDIPPFRFRLSGLNTKDFLATARNEYKILRRQDYAQSNHIAHVQLFSGETITSDSMMFLPAGTEVFGPVEVLNEFDRTKLWIFNAKGELVYSDDLYWLNTIVLSSSLSGAKVAIKDKLTKSVEGTGDKHRQKKITNVQASSKADNSEIGFHANKDFNNYRRAMLDRGKVLFESPSCDRWFPKGPLGACDSILYIKSLLERGIEQAWVVDPFFDKKALEAIVPRISKRGLTLTIITNIHNVDPENGELIGEDSPSLVNDLEKFAVKIKPFIHCHLKIINLLKSQNSPRQAFHDRYLCLKSNAGEFSVFLLSNSLNSFMGEYPFCMSRVDGDVARDLQEYIITLADKIDPVSNKELYCNMEWDSHA
ncbi:VPA1262 family N-terminal domain-containing protein [Desulfovibrio sp. JC010]|uniref:VPA1262 family N-terminal domain-containing protein n=1 Tax=Desulfovibrio sp. JC010 TaxID=2593641 RepID=UPI0013D270C7|nr:hypothetical protein [Desulfovibrio sp. JC010]